MSPLKRNLALSILGIVLAVSAYTGWRFYRMYNPPLETELPEFTALPEGPRAPTSEGLGVLVGKTTLAETQALLEARGLTCQDTSARALMAASREAKKKEIEEVKAKGGDVDAVTGASMLYKRSPKEKNPQVRWTCLDVPSKALGDRPRVAAEGRWLFVFDSPEHPVRSVSYRRSQRSQAAALKEFDDAVAAMTTLYGPPTRSDGEPLRPGSAEEGGAEGEEGVSAPGAEAATTADDAQGASPPKAALAPANPGEIFPRLRTIRRIWSFADVEVKVTALNFGARGIDLLEAVEVPWPVRADAPALPAGAAQAQGE